MLVGLKKLLLSDTTASLLPVGLAQEATDHPFDVVCDEDIEEAFRVLEEHHDRIIADGDDDVQVLDFAVAVQGGAWSLKKHGRACDSFKGRVRLGSDAAEWCQVRGSAVCSVRRAAVWGSHRVRAGTRVVQAVAVFLELAPQCWRSSLCLHWGGDRCLQAVA